VYVFVAFFFLISDVFLFEIKTQLIGFRQHPIVQVKGQARNKGGTDEKGF